MVSLPTVGGALLGRWLDQSLGTNLSFTLGFLLFGLCIGGYTVWRFFLKEVM
jgi:ATP synthase protein I